MSDGPLVADVVFTGVPVRDLGAAGDWYGRLLGRPPDVLVHEGEVMWRLAEAAWLYVLVDPDRAGGSIVTVSVADLDATVRLVAAAGIATGPVEAVGDAGRKSVLADPDGNEIALIEVRGA